MKWEPVAAMAALLAIGLWIVYAPSIRYDTRPGAELSRMQIGNVRGDLEAVRDQNGDVSFRFLFRDHTASPVMTAAQFKAAFGPEVYTRAAESGGNVAFRILNVTNWTGVIWVLVGLGGQLAFAGRWLIQWFVSEKRRESYIPESFWWTSMIAGAVLFAYFAWRQDIVGVLGQTSGIVVYARNVRLIHKKKRRDARDAAKRPPEPPAASERPIAK